MEGSGARSIGDSGRFEADDRPLGLAACHLLEAGVVVHGPFITGERLSLAYSSRGPTDTQPAGTLPR